MAGPGAHSPVGGSAAKRITACPPSVALAQGIEDEESDHAALGTATHTLIEHCFKTNTDAWMHMGSRVLLGDVSPGVWPADQAVLGTGKEGAFFVDRKMSLGAQTMLDAVRKAHPDRNQSNFGVERHFHCPTIHPLFFSTTDVWALSDVLTPGQRQLDIWDYKNGAGVIVEVEENGQGMYYAAGVLETLELWDKIDKVVIHIVQPNAWHVDGPVREWTTTADHIAYWMECSLVPAMNAAVNMMHATPQELADRAVSGDHCRFCPARSHACPALLKDMEELRTMVEMMEQPGAAPLTNEQVGRFATLLERAKIAGKAAGNTAYTRMLAGQQIPGWKLVKAKTNRAWNNEEEAKVAAEPLFGTSAFTKPSLKSPAQIADLPRGTDFVARHASKPDAGLSAAPITDRRTAVTPVNPASLFTDVTKEDKELGGAPPASLFTDVTKIEDGGPKEPALELPATPGKRRAKPQPAPVSNVVPLRASA